MTSAGVPTTALTSLDGLTDEQKQNVVDNPEQLIKVLTAAAMPTLAWVIKEGDFIYALKQLPGFPTEKIMELALVEYTQAIMPYIEQQVDELRKQLEEKANGG